LAFCSFTLGTLVIGQQQQQWRHLTAAAAAAAAAGVQLMPTRRDVPGGQATLQLDKVSPHPLPSKPRHDPVPTTGAVWLHNAAGHSW
jgi:hypothetical protein